MFPESVIPEIQNIWGSSFFWKYWKFNVHFKNAVKNREIFFFWDNCIWIGIVKLSLLRTGYILLAANVLTSSPKIWNVNKRDFLQPNWLGSDMLKVLWCWFQQCFGTCTMFLVKVSSQTWLFRHLYHHVFGVRHFENTKSLRVIFFSKYLKFMIDIKNAAKN